MTALMGLDVIGAYGFLAKAHDMLRWFVLLVALLLDPAAVLLLCAASRRGDKVR